MILHLFRRTLKEHLGFHLLIPVALIFGSSAIGAWLDPQVHPHTLDQWLGFAWQWPMSHIGPLIEVYLAFFLVVGWTIKRASDVQSTRVETIRDLLPDTKRYFAIGVIPLREWFEPNTTVYLATVIHHKMAHPADFAHERVLVFTRERDLKAVSLSYLDQPYAKAFNAIHEAFEIPLSYMPPEPFMRIVSTLPADQRKALAFEKTWLVKIHEFIRWIPASWTLRRIRPFVLLEDSHKEQVIVRFEKHGATLTLARVEDAAFVQAAKGLVAAITKEIYKPGTSTPKETYSFNSFLKY